MPDYGSIRKYCVWNTIASSLLLEREVEVQAEVVDVREISRNHVIKGLV